MQSPAGDGRPTPTQSGLLGPAGRFRSGTARPGSQRSAAPRRISAACGARVPTTSGRSEISERFCIRCSSTVSVMLAGGSHVLAIGGPSEPPATPLQARALRHIMRRTRGQLSAHRSPATCLSVPSPNLASPMRRMVDLGHVLEMCHQIGTRPGILRRAVRSRCCRPCPLGALGGGTVLMNSCLGGTSEPTGRVASKL